MFEEHQDRVFASVLARAGQGDAQSRGPYRPREIPRHRGVPVVEHGAELIRGVALRPGDERRAETGDSVLERRHRILPTYRAIRCGPLPPAAYRRLPGGNLFPSSPRKGRCDNHNFSRDYTSCRVREGRAHITPSPRCPPDSSRWSPARLTRTATSSPPSDSRASRTSTAASRCDTILTRAESDSEKKAISHLRISSTCR